MAIDPSYPGSGSETISVALGERSYEIAIGARILSSITAAIHGWLVRRGMKGGSGRLAIVVTDDHVRDRHGVVVANALRQAGWNCETVSLPAGEQSKSQQCVSEVYDRLVDAKADRQTPIVAVGGGV